MFMADPQTRSTDNSELTACHAIACRIESRAVREKSLCRHAIITGASSKEAA